MASPGMPAPNGMPPLPPGPVPPPTPWSKHLSPDGRPFWTNAITKESVWNKPRDLMTPPEREADETTDFQELESGGRPYWLNKQTKETTWTRPKVIEDIFAKHAAMMASQSPNSRAPAFVGAAGSPAVGSGMSPAGPPGGPLTPAQGSLVGAAGGSSRPPSSMPTPMRGLGDDSRAQGAPQPVMTNGVPSFATHAEAEQAFIDMLKQKGVTPSWSWEQVMRETITEPLYKALKTLSERKAAFEKFCIDTKKEAQQMREDSLNKSRKDWQKALDKLNGGPASEQGIKVWWSFERARRELESKHQDVWSLPRNDDERRTLFNEYIDSLKQSQETERKERRSKNMDKVTQILQSLELDLAGSVKWQDVRAAVQSAPQFLRDTELQKIEPIDVLNVYEDELRKSEKEANELRAKQNEERRRRHRKARDEFVALLEELKAADHITAGTRWKSVYPVIATDPRYLNLLGVPGSSPLDLFFDMVDVLDQQFDDEMRQIEDALDQASMQVKDDTTFESFQETIDKDSKVAAMDYATKRAAFEKLRARHARMLKDERRKAERKLRLLVDDLRYAYKKLDPPVDLDSSYEDNLNRIKDTPEFQALEGDDDSRKLAFEKFVRRQKEKLTEREEDDRRDRDKDKGRDRERSDRDRERERDRDSDRRHRGEDRERTRRGSDVSRTDERHYPRSSRRRGSSAHRGSSEAVEEERHSSSRSKRDGSRPTEGDQPARKQRRIEVGANGDAAMASVTKEEVPEEGEIA
ncbi:U1 snRNP protein [Microbotryomycetes sp. JL221]|nr:U1 snRNP protein [Microbotryomycetes sp. JL221]